MTDLPTELRSLSKLDHSDVLGEKMRDAADEIERLRTQLDNTRELLPTAWTEGDCIDWEEERMTDYVVKTWHDANGTITAETVSHIDGEDVGAQEVVDLIREQQAEIDRLRDKLANAVSETTLERLVDLFEEYREFFGMANSDFPEDKPQDKQCKYEEEFLDILCEYYGHDIGPDQCGKPEHDLCYRCRRRRVDIEREVTDD